MKRLNLGAGHDILTGWINHDGSPLPQIDIAHDLNEIPWPWENNEFDEVLARDVLEHLNHFVPAMEELWRIMKTGAILTARVPYMGSWSYFSDPTHKRAFHETTFSHFDPTSPYCGDRSYYSTARFRIEAYSYVLAPFIPFFTIPGIGEFKVRRKWSKLIIGFIGMFLVSNLIQGLEIRMRKVE
jgi:SAM-dependent methyltransferase